MNDSRDAEKCSKHEETNYAEKDSNLYTVA